MKSHLFIEVFISGSIAASFLYFFLLCSYIHLMIPREVNATINGEDFTFSSKAHTVETFLEKEDIEFHDKDYIRAAYSLYMMVWR